MPKPSTEVDSRRALVRVVVVTPLGRGGRGGIDRLMDELRTEFETRPPEGLDVAFATSRGPHALVLSPFYLLATMLQLAVRKASGRVDLVHINLSQDGSAYRKMAIAGLCRMLNLPYVIHLHGSHFDRFWDCASPRLDRALTRLFSHAASIIVLGNHWSHYVGRKLPAAADRIVIMPTASRDVPLSQPKRDASRPVQILFLGQLGPRKGTPQLLAALDRIRQNDRWRTVLAGDGDIDAARAKLKALELDGRCTVTGWVSDEQVGMLLASSDILVLPSFDEGLPLSIVEACAHAMAIVTTPVGAIEDVIQPEQTGLLVPPGDSVALAEALERLVEDPSLRARLGRNARAVFEERLNIEACAKRLSEVWRQAAER